MMNRNIADNFTNTFFIMNSPKYLFSGYSRLSNLETRNRSEKRIKKSLESLESGLRPLDFVKKRISEKSILARRSRGHIQ
jgi:hypothetical protein